MSESTERFLVVRLSSLGDLVHTLPAFAALRSSFPHARIDWLVDRRWSSLLELVPGIDEVIALGRSVRAHIACIRRLRRARYAYAVDFQGRYKSAMLAWLSGAEHRIGRDRKAAREPGADWFYTEPVNPTGRHIAEMNVSLALRAGAQPPAELQFPLRVPENEARQLREKLSREGINAYIVVSPGGGWKSKRWPSERYGALCAELWRLHGLRAVVNVAPGEEGLARGVVNAAGPAKPLVVCPSLPELVALVAGTRLVVAADTGPLHLAAALGTRVVGLFGSTDPARNSPLPQGVVVQNVSSKPPIYKRGDYVRGRVYSPAMLSLTVDQVLAAVEREISITA
jgi:lipopolysaccharide heptosyltransferase I